MTMTSMTASRSQPKKSSLPDFYTILLVNFIRVRREPAAIGEGFVPPMIEGDEVSIRGRNPVYTNILIRGLPRDEGAIGSSVASRPLRQQPRHHRAQLRH